MTRENRTTRLITHSGSFHADDVLSFIVLSRLFPEARLLRTRDQDVLGSVTAEDIVFDVGYAYDSTLRRYDHHQPCRHFRDDGSPYSSFGLVWLHHGREYVLALCPDLDVSLVEAVWASVDRRFVTDIDHADNGYVAEGRDVPLSATTVSLLVEDYVPSWDEDANYDDRFLEAAAAFSGILEHRVRKAASRARAEEAVVAAFHAAKDPRVVVIPDYMPVGSVVSRYDFHQAVYLVEHGRSGEWFVNCVRPEGNPFGQRKPLPSRWAGLRDDALAAVTGVEDAVFCHLERFTCAARSLESALRMAYMALDDTDIDSRP